MSLRFLEKSGEQKTIRTIQRPIFILIMIILNIEAVDIS